MANIAELIESIRSAIYGKDVRESIAASIEQVYEDATQVDPANTILEVIQARGTYANLNARENAQDTAISTIQSNINAEAAARAAADNTLQTNISAEASTRASADSNLQSQINQIVAPSGSAPSAAEVQNARIGADGVTYSTLGDAIRTQITNTNEILSNAVKVKTPPEKTTFFEGLENIYDPNDTTVDGYYSRTNVFTADTSLRQTGLTPVFPGKQITFYSANNGYVLWYGENDNNSFINYENYTTPESKAVTLTVPDDAFYVRIPYTTQTEASLRINEGSTLLDKTPYAPHIPDKYMEFIDQPINLFNPADPDVIRGKIYDRTNALVNNSTLGDTGYISVEPGETIAFAPHTSGYVLWYDIGKTFITYTNYQAASVYVTAPANAYFIRLFFVLAEETQFIVNKGRVVAPYQSYIPAPRIKSSYLSDYISNQWDGLKGVAFGTSLTYRAQTTGGYLLFLPGLSGMTWDNQGVGSSVILNNGTQPNMMATITGYSSWSDKNLCILEGFVNDWYYNGASLGTWKDTGTTTVCGCVRNALTHILTQKVGITLVVVLDPVGQNYGGVDCSSLATRSNLTQSEFYDEVEKVCNSIGVPVIRLDKCGGMSENTPYMYIDNIHPSTQGAQQTANTIWSELKNISVKVTQS